MSVVLLCLEARFHTIPENSKRICATVFEYGIWSTELLFGCGLQEMCIDEVIHWKSSDEVKTAVKAAAAIEMELFEWVVALLQLQQKELR